ncbi:MAG: 4-hydroxy-tetrahydrodipicolinate reductase [Gammaproteobacteria bacterium]|jgi:4-hydroxy-tetrahydrodipicolinate reductase|nr:4-hydroxy-tetrahydrodipicolinate reductase [Gammaproteobacteria bacterium]
MGRAVIDIAAREPDLELSAAWVREGDARSGQPVANWHPAAADTAAVTSADLDRVLDGADVVVDFSLPVTTSAVLDAVERNRVPLVCGVTGVGRAELERMGAVAATVPVVYDRNMSVGVQLLNFLVREAAARLGADYDAEITEAHHRAKRDAPSGTALMLGETLAAARGESLEKRAVYARQGESGPRQRGAIGFSVIRAGAIVGEHTVTFAGDYDRLSLGHQAQDRAAFASGALAAARWLADRPAGLYAMADVLAIR